MPEQLNRNQVLIEKLTGIILANLENESFGVKKLVQESGLSRSRLRRSLFAATQKTPHQFINETRLMKAREFLINEDLNASEVAYRTGFSSPAYFNKCFHKFFGFPPGKVKKGDPGIPSENRVPQPVSERKQKRLFTQTFKFLKAWLPLMMVIFVTVVVMIYRSGSVGNTLEVLRSPDGRISVAVMPFRNLTGDTSLNIWQGLIQDNLINSFSNNPEELKVRQTESINRLLGNEEILNYASVTPSAAKEISRKLDADLFVYGSIQRADSSIRISAQLIDSKTEEIIKTFELDGHYRARNFIAAIDSLRSMLANYLVISKLGMNAPPSQRLYESPHPDAFRYYIHGDNAMMRGDFSTALTLFSKAIEIDTTFSSAMMALVLQYLNFARYSDARNLAEKVYRGRDQMPLVQKYHADWIHAFVFESPRKAISCLRQSLEIDDQRPGPYYLIGMHYNSLLEYDKAIPEFEKALDLYKKWGAKPGYGFYTSLGFAYHKTGLFKKEKKLYGRAEKDYPENAILCFRQAVLALSIGDTMTANRSIEKYKSIRKDQLWTDLQVATSLAGMYSQAKNYAKAEEYYLLALSLDSLNPVIINNLAAFYIENDTNIDEALAIVSRALLSHPDNYDCLDTKGRGLYKQERYQEALEILQKSWHIRMQNAIYNHSAFLHLAEAEKAVAGQKSN